MATNIKNRMTSSSRLLDDIIADVTARQEAEAALKLTPEEIKNGWTLESLTAYRQERERAAGYRVAGNVVTRFDRGRPPIRVENVQSYDPHKLRMR